YRLPYIARRLVGHLCIVILSNLFILTLGNCLAVSLRLDLLGSWCCFFLFASLLGFQQGSLGRRLHDVTWSLRSAF
ncbi:MAG: hypothetical protein VX694_01275, partial [Planctomycetota bacterium]|nr:hypothetical protein [Planctomycetota bacterium]